jgi:hypothetical protein
MVDVLFQREQKTFGDKAMMANTPFINAISVAEVI